MTLLDLLNKYVLSTLRKTHLLCEYRLCPLFFVFLFCVINKLKTTCMALYLIGRLNFIATRCGRERILGVRKLRRHQALRLADRP